MSEFIDREEAIANIKAAYCSDCNDYGGVKCRACQLMDAIDVLEDEPSVNLETMRLIWHPTSEIPPLVKRYYCDDGEPFVFYESAPLLLLMRDGDMKTGWFNRSGTGDCWMDEDGQTYNHRIAYWMELPEPPEGVPHD